MATALASGCLRAGLATPAEIVASDPSPEARAKFAASVPGSLCTADNAQVLDFADMAILAVKPQTMAGLLAEIGGRARPEQVLVSIAAGITLERLAAALPPRTRLVRVMPNTPCLIGRGASAYSLGPSAAEADATAVRALLESVGEAYEVPESYLDAVTGLSGSGPAFVYTAIEGLARGGAAMGLPHELALRLAAQTARGAAEMVQSTGLSPAELRDQVTSPGGTTLAGLQALTEAGAAEAFAAAVTAATQRSRELGRS